MSEHARLSPSGSKKWMSCPGSLVLEAAYPNVSTEYSDEGTAMHTVAAWCLQKPQLISAYVGRKIAIAAAHSVVFTQEMAELVLQYVNIVQALAEGHELHVEQRVEFSEFVGESAQFGTADAIILRSDAEMLVIDLKTGYTFVEVENNTQLLLYALGAWAKFHLTHPIKTIRCMIYQPKQGGMREWTIPVGEMQ